MSDPATCKGCGAKVIFGVDGEGTNVIIDARRHPIYVQNLDDVWIRAESARISHFVTCPKRDQFSKGRTKEPTT